MPYCIAIEKPLLGLVFRNMANVYAICFCFKPTNIVTAGVNFQKPENPTKSTKTIAKITFEMELFHFECCIFKFRLILSLTLSLTAACFVCSFVRPVNGFRFKRIKLISFRLKKKKNFFSLCSVKNNSFWVLEPDELFDKLIPLFSIFCIWFVRGFKSIFFCPQRWSLICSFNLKKKN